MNSILIVLPILALLMFEIGLTLRAEDFRALLHRPRPVLVALAGQIVLLPLVAFALAELLQLPPIYYVGLILIACCPGGSSSNVFSMLAGGDVALSVSLTAMNSLITLLTLPVIMVWATARGGVGDVAIHLPVGQLLVQNLVLMLLPVCLGALVRRRWAQAAERTERVLRKSAFPLLMVLATVFFIENREAIILNAARVGGCCTALLVCCLALAGALSRVCRTTRSERRTIVLEVGMQNAAQAIAIAGSPFVFNCPEMAVPAILYALMMNVVLLIYVAICQRADGRRATD